MRSEKDLGETQKDAIDHLFHNDEIFFIAPKGFGKCIIALNAACDLIEDGYLTRVLVLAPAQVCTQTWANEPELWSQIKQPLVCLTGDSGDSRKKMMSSDAKIVVCNFENLAWLLEEYPKIPFDGLIIDEITKLKKAGKGNRHAKLRKHIKKFKWRVGMTADPVAQDNADIYGQMLLVDAGVRLGRNKDLFLRKYFMQMDYKGYKWELQETGQTRLTNVLEDIIYKVSDAQYIKDLPILKEHVIEVPMTSLNRVYYNTLAKDGFVMIGDEELEAPMEATVRGKMHQIANGAVYITDEDEKKKTRRCVTLCDKKVGALRELTGQIDTPVLVSYLFDFQKTAILDGFDAQVYSAKNSKKFNKELIKDWDAGQVPMLLVHPKSAGHGLNLQNGHCYTLINMAVTWSADDDEQLLGRIRRRGQKSKIVDRYRIVCKGTVEDLIMVPLLTDRGDASERFHTHLESLKNTLEV